MDDLCNTDGKVGYFAKVKVSVLQVLDATFDDIVPLAQTKMPEAICKLIF